VWARFWTAGLSTLLLGMGVALWLFLGPGVLKGPVDYVIIQGSSMEPVLHRGDLVLIRRGKQLGAGEIGAYRQSLDNQVIVHRVTGVQGGRLVFKGDNNAWTDTDTPTQAQVIGKVWFRAPQLGRAVAWLQSPWAAAPIAGALAAFVFWLVLPPVSPKRGTRLVTTARAFRWPALGGSSTPLIIGVATAVVLAAGAIGAMAFLMPSERAGTVELPYVQRGVFAYVADLPADKTAELYTEGLKTGDPLFLSVTPVLHLSFTYELRGLAPADSVGGVAKLYFVTRDVTGWQHVDNLMSATAFSGTSFSVTRDVDLRHIMEHIVEFQEVRQGASTFFTTAAVAEIAMEGVVQGVTISDAFMPFFTWRVRPPNEMYVETPESQFFQGLASPATAQANPFFHEHEKNVAIPLVEPNTLRILAWRIPVIQLRYGVLGAGALAVVVALVGVLGLRSARALDEPRRIRLQYGGLLVSAEFPDPGTRLATIRVKTFEELVRLARQRDGSVLWEELPTSNRYFLIEEGAVYLYEIVLPKPKLVEPKEPRIVA